jgi:hypothetical protein
MMICMIDGFVETRCIASLCGTIPDSVLALCGGGEGEGDAMNRVSTGPIIPVNRITVRIPE